MRNWRTVFIENKAGGGCWIELSQVQLLGASAAVGGKCSCWASAAFGVLHVGISAARGNECK